MEILRPASLTYLRPLSLSELAAIAPLAAEISHPALAGSSAHHLALVARGRGRVRCAGEPIAAA